MARQEHNENSTVASLNGSFVLFPGSFFFFHDSYYMLAWKRSLYEKRFNLIITLSSKQKMKENFQYFEL